MESGFRRIMDNDVLMKIGCDGMSSVVKSNMLMIETALPSLISLMHPWLRKRKGHASMNEVVAFLVDMNPMDISDEMKEGVYKGIMCRWLSHVAIYPNVELPWANGAAPCSRLEIQHGDSFISVWAVHASISSVLLPYCFLELSDSELIIRYRDLSAPTRLYHDLCEVLSLMESQPSDAYARLSEILLRLHDRYSYQSSAFDAGMLRMINGQVY